MRNLKGFLKILLPVRQDAGPWLLGLSGSTAGGGCCWSVCQQLGQAGSKAVVSLSASSHWSTLKQAAVVGSLTWWSVARLVKV